MQPIEIIGIIIEIQFSCQLQKIWASGQSKTLGPTKRRLKNGETSVLKKIDGWNEKTKTSFGTKCYEHILSDDKLIQSANLEDIELLTSAYKAKNFIVIPRIARSLAINIDSEIEWQNGMLWKYVEEEILGSFTEDKLV